MKKNIFTFIITLMVFTLMAVFPLKPANVSASASGAQNLHQQTKIYRGDEEDCVNGSELKSDYNNQTAKITVLTHGYGADASHWSNDGSGDADDFKPNTDSIIHKINASSSNGISLYFAQCKGKTFELYKLSDSDYTVDTATKVDMIDDVSKHIVLIYNSQKAGHGHNAVYEEFDYLLDSISLQYKALSGKLPLFNLVGHSRGGVINLMYTMRHPYNVLDVFSVGTPYRGSRLGMFDIILGLVKITTKAQGVMDILSEETPTLTADSNTLEGDPTCNVDLRNEWNATVASGTWASVTTIGTMMSEEAIQRLLEDPAVQNYASQGFVDFLTELVAALNTYAEATNLILDVVAGLIYLEDAYLNSLGIDLGSGTLPNVADVLRLVHCINGELVVADDFFIDTDSQLGQGFKDGKSFQGFNRYLKILTAEDIAGPKSEPLAPAIGHNVEAMNDDIGSFIVNSMQFGYSTTMPESISDEQQTTVNRYKAYLYKTEYSGQRKITVTDVDAVVYQYFDNTYLREKAPDANNEYSLDANVVYYVVAKPCDGKSYGTMNIEVATLIKSSKVLFYNGSLAIRIGELEEGFYKIALPEGVALRSSKAFRNIGSTYASYFEKDEFCTIYLKGGAVGTISIIVERASEAQEEQPTSYSETTVLTLSNSEAVGVDYKLRIPIIDGELASIKIFDAAMNDIHSTIGSADEYSETGYYCFLIEKQTTLCIILGNAEGGYYEITKEINNFIWYIDDVAVDGNNYKLTKIDQDRTVKLKRINDDGTEEMLIQLYCSATNVHSYKNNANVLNVKACMFGNHFTVSPTQTSEIILNIIVIPDTIGFEAVNNDGDITLKWNFDPSENFVSTSAKYGIVINVNSIYYSVLGMYTVRAEKSNLSLNGESSSSVVWENDNYPTTLEIVLVSIWIPHSDTSNKIEVYNDTYGFSVGTIVLNTHFQGGGGVRDFPYEISTRKHLENLTFYSGAHYILMNNIDLGTTLWTPIKQFNGTLYGNNKKISGLDIDTTGGGYFGLFGINYGSIKDLTINAEITIRGSQTTGTYVGMVCGENRGYIHDCISEWKTATSKVEYDTANSKYVCHNFAIYCTQDDSKVGGIAGINYKYIERCINKANIFANGDVGGITGENCGEGSIYMATNYGHVAYLWMTNNRSIGGIVGYFSGGYVQYCTNYAEVGIYNIATDSRVLQPCIGQIIGYACEGTTITDNTQSGSVSCGNLQKVTWFIGSHDQTIYAGDREIGRNDN